VVGVPSGALAGVVAPQRVAVVRAVLPAWEVPEVVVAPDRAAAEDAAR
jgi:hypothetical protein